MKLFSKTILYGLTLSAIVALASCGKKVEQVPVNSTNSQPQVSYYTQESGGTSVANKTEAIKFKLEGGGEAFTLKPKSDGAKLVDKNERELARFNVDNKQKVKIKDASDRVLSYIVPEKGYWKIENADQTKELYILRQQTDGDYKLEDGQNKEIYRIKKRDYGLEIETPKKQSLYKVKAKNGKIELRDASDKTILYTNVGIKPIAIACFGFDVLSREQKAALAYAVNRSGG